MKRHESQNELEPLAVIEIYDYQEFSKAYGDRVTIPSLGGAESYVIVSSFRRDCDCLIKMAVKELAKFIDAKEEPEKFEFRLGNHVMEAWVTGYAPRRDGHCHS